MQGGNDGDVALDNNPMPPMGPDPQNIPMDAEQQEGSMPNEVEPVQQQGNESDDAELTDLINSLSVEDKAAVMKYAKSMANDNGSNDMQESVNKTADTVKDDKKSTRDETELPKKYRGKKNNPFVSPY